VETVIKPVRPNKSAGVVQSKPYGCECFVPSNPAGLLHNDEGLFGGNHYNTGLFAVSTTITAVVAMIFSITTLSATKCLFNGYITARCNHICYARCYPVYAS